MLQFLTFIWNLSKYALKGTQVGVKIKIEAESSAQKRKDLNHCIIKFISETCFLYVAYVFHFVIDGLSRETVDGRMKKGKV